MAIELFPFEHFRRVRPSDLPPSALVFLRHMKAPTVIDIDGKDSSQTIVISTLIHGNEPSGFFAMYRLLKSDFCPHYNVRFIVSSPEAANNPPFFHTRFVDGDVDLNRQFSQESRNPVGLRAREIKTLISEVSPIAVLDLHNTSGRNPAFAISIEETKLVHALASFFTQTLIITGLRLGSLMEQNFGCPVVTIECGACNDPLADDTAFNGLQELLASTDISLGSHNGPVNTLHHPMRLELTKEASLAYADEAVTNTDITLVSDIEQHNFGYTRSGCVLGWVGRSGLKSLQLKDEQGQHLSTKLFDVVDNQLVTAERMQIFMATTQSHLAKSDCLFYLLLSDL